MGLKIDIQKKMAGFELNVKFEAAKKPLALLGSSGSGKSMTLRCIAGLEKPDYGTIETDDAVLFSKSKNINIHPGKRKVGFIFQNYALFPHLTVYENIAFGLGNKTKDEKHEIIHRELKKVHLKGFEKRYPNQLSGGQQQRAAIARALSLEPEILLLDEPFSALDDHIRGIVVREIGEMLEEFKGTAIFVTHNMEEAYRLCENIAIISKGREEAYGSREEVFKNPGTVETARITGCKNILEAAQIKENRVFVNELNKEFIVTSKTAKEISYIGIRANHIAIVSNNEKENCILCTPEYVSESPFRVTVFMKPVGCDNDELVIQCELSKSYWINHKNRENIYNLYIKPEDIFAMSN